MQTVHWQRQQQKPRQKQHLNKKMSVMIRCRPKHLLPDYYRCFIRKIVIAKLLSIT